MRKLLGAMVGLLLVAGAVVGGVAWTAFRVYVPEGMCAVLTRKTGEPLPAGEVIATKRSQKGVQLEPLGPGRYFLNPYAWEYRLVPLTKVPAGDPTTWEWTSTTAPGTKQPVVGSGRFAFTGTLPKVGVVVRKFGDPAPPGMTVVPMKSTYKGILREVLTPGEYRINPDAYEVALVDALFIPSGFVGVVTNQFDDPDTQVAASAPAAVEEPEPAEDEVPAPVPADTIPEHGAVLPLAEPGHRGTLRDVLQPGLYFINPKWQKVEVVEIGYHELSQVAASEGATTMIFGEEEEGISFQSDSGFTIDVGVTVVWGLHPSKAAAAINEFGNIETVLAKVIEPQLRSICRNVGSNYEAVDFIQGERREEYQNEVTDQLRRVCAQKHIDILIALVRNIEVRSPQVTGEVGDQDLKRTLQETHIAYENQLTKERQRAAATVNAQLEEARKKVDLARDTVRAETEVLVADVLAQGGKQSAEIRAQTELDIAAIQEQIAQLDAQRTEILGRAHADVERLKNEAEAKGYQMLVSAFGSGQAYNLYTFAQNFQPDSIRLFFAGEGTFWTDLTRFEEVGAARLLQPADARGSSRTDAP